ncbi:MAG: hypothetical protein KJZ64_05690, partial [Sphingomonadaceae bacterium]|nr:hypothetical protein [Sphingomonadaceae bacterium]
MQQADLPLRRLIGEVPVLVVAMLLFALCTGLLASKGIWPDIGPVLANIRLYLLNVLAIASIDAARCLVRER